MSRSLHRSALVAVILAISLFSPLLAQSVPSAAAIRQLIEAKKFGEAEQVLATAGDDITFVALRAELFRKTDRLDDAYREYQKVAAANPSSVDAQFWLSTIDRWKGRNNDAVNGYGKVLALAKCHGDALTGRARAYESLANYAAAEADLRTALICHPRDAEATEILAALLLRQNHGKDAELLLRNTFSGVELERRLGDLEMTRPRGGNAREHYRAALKLQPNDPALLAKLGDAERVLGNNAAALALYEQSAEIAGNGGNLYWIGILSMRLGRLDRAEAAFDDMLKVKPGDSGALIGKARIRRSQRRTSEALDYVNLVLQRDPANGEALVLRGALEESLGRTSDARNDYLAAVSRNRNDGDARLLLDRIGPSNFVKLSGRSDRSRVIEGLEDLGVIIQGVPIRPARIEYINDYADLETRVEIGSRTALDGAVRSGREAVRNNDSRYMIYDFDVVSALAGLDHQLTDNWRFGWRVGGTRYEPRTNRAISSDERFRGSLELAYRRGADELALGYDRRTFIQRGFAGDTQFSIFDEDRFSISWGRYFGGGMSVRFNTAASTFDRGDSPVNGGVTVRWDRGENAFYVRAGHDPFPTRYLGPNQRLEFVDFDGLTVGLRRKLGAGFRFSGDATWGRYGETRRDTVVDGVRIEGPLDNNTGKRANAELAWSPRAYRPFSIGGAYDYANFDFRTSPYNTRNFNDRSFFTQLEDRENLRTRYMVRAEHHWVSDNRSNEVYDGNAYVGLLELRLGSYPKDRGSYWLGLEGGYQENDLAEERYRVRAYLTIPF